LVTDGRGTPGRGPAWEREIYGDIFGPVLEDQVSALVAAARHHPELDLTRVGIRGWSFSGALAVMRRPDIFHAAVAGAAVTDQRLYDTHWRQRFLGHPAQHSDRYDACSLLLEAPKLTRCAAPLGTHSHAGTSRSLCRPMPVTKASTCRLPTCS
jgi:dipeptidyl-peptidase 4